MKFILLTSATLRMMAAFVLCGIMTGTIHAAVSKEPWIMHRIDPDPFAENHYGGYNSISPGDFNKDGYMDYVVVQEFLGWIGATILFHPGDDSLGIYDYWEKVEVINPPGNNTEHAQVGDFDKDGNLDILVLLGSEHENPAELLIIWGPDAQDVKNPNAWTESISFGAMGSSAGNPLYSKVKDIDNDGDLDFFAGGRGEGLNYDKATPFFGLRWAECPNEDYRNIDKWKIHEVDPDIKSGHGFIFADLDGDGDDDIVVNNADFNTAPDERATLWYENRGPGSYNENWPRHIIHKDPDYFIKSIVTAGDLDKDGKTDLAIPLGYDRILWFKNTGSSPPTFETIVITKPLPVQQVQRPIEIFDINGDGKNDIVGGNLHYAYHTTWGNPQGYFPPDKYSLFWMEYSGDIPKADNWTAYPIKRAFGSSSGVGHRGEKTDVIRFVDIDGDGDMDILANSEESFDRYDKNIFTHWGIAWFENTETSQTAADDFESGNMSGGTGWASPWEKVGEEGQVKVVKQDLEGEYALHLRSDSSVVMRTLSKSIENGLLEFRWRTAGGPDYFIIEVYDGKWRHLLTTYPNNLNKEDGLPWKNEMLALSKFGKVTKIRFSLTDTGEDDDLFIDQVIIKERTQ